MVASSTVCLLPKQQRSELSEVRYAKNGSTPFRNAPADKDSRQNARPVSIREVLLRRYAGAGLLCVLLLLLGAYTTSRSPYFLTERNLGNLVIQIAPLALVAVGQMMTILISGIDLSVGPSMSLITALASFVIVGNAQGTIATGVAICLIVGILIGALNGFIILFLRIPDLIATLSTFSVVTGFALIVRPSPGGKVSGVFCERNHDRNRLVADHRIGGDTSGDCGRDLAAARTDWCPIVRDRFEPGGGFCRGYPCTTSTLLRLFILWFDGCVERGWLLPLGSEVEILRPEPSLPWPRLLQWLLEVQASLADAVRSSGRCSGQSC